MRSLLASALLLLWGYNLVLIVLPVSEARLVPKHYTLHLKIDPLNKTLSGTVRCRVHVEENIELIEMFTDSSVSVKNVTISNSTNNLRVSKIEKKPTNRLHLALEQKLVKNVTYDLTVIFEGVRATNYSNNSSFYAVNWTNKASNQSTLFYIIDLTKNTTNGLFPCFYGAQYTSFKTPFNLTVIRPKSFKVATISNTSSARVQSKQYSDCFEDTYLQTIPIRIHAFALIATNNGEIIEISKQESLSCPNEKIIFGVNKNVVRCALRYLTDFYGVSPPANAVHVVAIPEVFNISIHSLGLKTLGVDSFKHPKTNLKVEDFIYRLNDLWWSYIPDNIHAEANSLISSLAQVATNDVFSKIIRTSNASEYENFAYLLNWSYNCVIQEEWKRNKNASECYFHCRDTLTLNMIKDILGTQLFSAGLKNLLSNKHDNPLKEDDVWKHLTEVATKNGTFKAPDFPQSVKEIVQPFRNRSLFSIPIIEFHSDIYGSFGGFIRQVPYAFTKSAYDSQVYRNSVNRTGTLIWNVPIKLASQTDKLAAGQHKPLVWAKIQNRAIALANVSQKEILLLNADLRGPFLVNYRKNNWDKIFDKFDSLETKYKTRFIVDLHVLAESGQLNYTDYMRYVLKVKPTKENLPVWANYLNLIPQVERTLSGKAQNLTTQWFVKQLSELYNKYLNVSAEQPFWITTLRTNVQGFLCMRNVSGTCNETAEFKVLLNNTQHPQQLQPAYVCSALKNKTITHQQWLLLTSNITKYCKNYTYCDISNAVHMLTNCSRNQVALSSLVNSIFKKTENVSCLVIKISIVLDKIRKTHYGSSIVFNYFVKNWKEIFQNFPKDVKVITEASVGDLKTEKEIKQALEFLMKEDVRKAITPAFVVEDSIQKLGDQLKWNNATLPFIEELMKEGSTVKHFGR